ncbi:MAG: spermidine synthase [Sphingomonadales bacterium]
MAANGAAHTALDTAAPPLTTRQHGLNLFLTGFLVLFLELACIRWFAATVIFMNFFTNIVLLACFLGMSCGCMAARARRDWLGLFPYLAVLTLGAALAVNAAYGFWSGLAIDVGNQASPQEIFFGTEYRDPDVAAFAVPMELIVGVFFVLIALMFVGIGQVLGRAFDAYPDRVTGYTLNIGGSLAGIAGFSLLSLVQAPPIVWFGISLAGFAFLLRQAGGLENGRVGWLRGAVLAGALLLAVVPGTFRAAYLGEEVRWSPYYAVQFRPDRHEIKVNNIGHQFMVPYEAGGSVYSLLHQLNRAAGGAPLGDQLIIGAGSGNDVNHALCHGVGRIDAVEIDPVILDIGRTENPDRPYDDPRVHRHLDDGRHFLRTTDRQYDAVVYALVDSLILHSSYANLRLESYLFTEQAMRDIKRVLKPGGVFVTYNYFRQGWVVQRVAAMAEAVFGCKPMVISLPYQTVVDSRSQGSGFTVVIAGCDTRIAAAFAERGPFWLHDIPLVNDAADGFAVRPDTMPAAEAARWQRIEPSQVEASTPRFATDDWPFLYLRDRMIPDLGLRSMAMIGLLGLAMVWLFLPRRPARGAIRFDARMFFLGAAFMLLETKAIVQLALLFGSTWFVNSMVFFVALVLVLLANLYVLKVRQVPLAWHYAGLLVLLGAAILTPFEVFLGGGVMVRYVVPCALALGPMFFAGVIFARSFRDSADPDMAFGSNIAGSVLGGIAESLSTLMGFQYLLLVAVAFYLLSAWRPRRAAPA